MDLAPQLILDTGSYLVALMFAVGAIHKLADRGRFLGVLADYALMPAGLLPLVALGLPLAELTAALFLAAPVLQAPGAILATGLLGLYGLAIVINLARGKSDISCGCGGPAQPISWGLALRNLGLAVWTGAEAWAGGASPTNARLACGQAAAMLFVVLEASNQLKANRRRMRVAAWAE